jgi:TP901 family phage tail tape measure protein
MAFKAGSIFGDAVLDTKKWDTGLGSMVTSAAKAGAAITAAIAAGLGASIKVANDFQIAMGNVNTIVDENVNNISDLAAVVITDLDPALGNATEITAGLYQAFSAGAEDSEEALQITIDAATFAIGVLTDTATAVDVLTSAQNAYGRDVVTTTQAADIFFNTVKEGKVTGDELASTIGTSIPLFAATGIKLEELAAGLAAMTKQGVNSANATTQLNAIVNAFLKPSEEMNILLQEMGAESGAAFLEAEGLSGALSLLEEATGGNAAELAKLLPNIRALRGAMALTGVGGDEFNEILGTMFSSVGQLDKAFGEQEKTFATFKNSMTNLIIPIGNVAKTFTDELFEGAALAAQGVTLFLFSNEGMDLVANVTATVAGLFGVLKEVVLTIAERAGPAFETIIDKISTALFSMKGETEGASTASVALALVTESIASTFIILAEAIDVPLRSLRNMVEMFQSAGEFLGAVFTGKFRKAAEAAKDFGSAFGEAFDIGEVIRELREVTSTVDSELSTFADRVNETAGDIEVSFKTSFDNTDNFIRQNWQDILTGQADFNSGFVDNMQAWVDKRRKILEDERAERQNITDQEDKLAEKRYQQEQENAKENAEDIEKTERDLASAIAGIDEGTTNQRIGSVTMRNAQLAEIRAAKDLAEQEALNIALAEAESARQTSWNEQLRAFREADAAIVEDTRTSTEVMQELWWENFQNNIELTSEWGGEILGLTKEITRQITSVNDAFRDAEKSKIEIARDTELRTLQENFDNQLISKEDYESTKEGIDVKYGKQLDALKKKQFKADKATKIAGVWINTASAIIGFWEKAAQLGPIAGPIFGGVMTGVLTGFAIAQTAAIASEEFVPAFQRGGTARGLSRINEGGGEILNLPDGTVVLPHDISQQIAAGAGSQTIFHISFAGANINSNMDLDRVVNEVSRKLGQRLRLAKI